MNSQGSLTMFFKTVTLFLVALSSLTCAAQLYDTPESRRLKADAEQSANDGAQETKSLPPKAMSFQDKENEALAYLGNTYTYVPNPEASKRIRFYERMPTSSFSTDPDFLFSPLATANFVVTGVTMAPPVMYPVGSDEYLLEVSFADGKVGYVNVVGCCGLRENLYKGESDLTREFVSLASVGAPSEKVALEEKYFTAKKKAELREKADRERSRALAAKDLERRRSQQAARDRMPPPTIGMTMDRVIKETTWGVPERKNRTVTARGTREQWVYGYGRYLYFDNGILTSIQY